LTKERKKQLQKPRPHKNFRRKNLKDRGRERDLQTEFMKEEKATTTTKVQVQAA